MGIHLLCQNCKTCRNVERSKEISECRSSEERSLKEEVSPTDKDLTSRELQTSQGDLDNGVSIHMASKIASLGGLGARPADREVARGYWSGRLDFLFSCIGMAVGLGNVWRFPFLCYRNGGGAFLVPYFMMLAAAGIPMFYLEVAMGQNTGLGPLSVWKFNPLLKGLGVTIIVFVWMVCVYYNVIVCHVLLYLFASLSAIGGTLPWVDCDHSWNTPNCVEFTYRTKQSDNNTNLSDSSSTVNSSNLFWNASSLLNTSFNSSNQGNRSTKTPTEEYYDRYVLDASDGLENLGSVNWKLCLCLLLAWVIILAVLMKGVKSLGKVVGFTALFPYVMLTVLFIRGVTLPGAVDGIIYYLKPSFSKLREPRVWIDAGTQIFYSLSIGQGVQMAMASYNKFHHNCQRDTIIVTLANSATSLYAGFVVFSVLGFMAHEKGVHISEVASGGPGLVFIVYPEALSRMPISWLWAILFFFMMAILGFGSMFTLVEEVTTSISDEFPNILRKPVPSMIFRTAIMFTSFLMGIPMICQGGIYLVNLVDFCIGGYPLFIIGLMEIIFIVYVYGYARLSDNIYLMLGKRPSKYWWITWNFASPIIMALTIVLNMVYYKPPTLDGYVYPPWTLGLVIIVALLPLIFIPSVFLIRLCRRGGYQALLVAARPDPKRELKEKERSSSASPRTPDHYGEGILLAKPSQ